MKRKEEIKAQISKAEKQLQARFESAEVEVLEELQRRNSVREGLKAGRVEEEIQRERARQK